GPLRPDLRAAGPRRELPAGRPGASRGRRGELDAPDHRGDPERRRSRGRRRRRHLGRGAAARPAGAGAGVAPHRAVDGRVPLPGARRARRLPRRRAGLPRLSQLPPLGVRERGGRSRSAPGRARAARGARSRAASPALLGLPPPRRARLLRAGVPATRGLSRHPLQARRRAALERRPDRRAGRQRLGRRDRLQGGLQGHGGRRRHGSRPLRARGGGDAGRLPRGPRSGGRRGSRRPRAARGAHHLGRTDPLGGGRARAQDAASRGQLEAVALRVLAGADALLRLLRRARHRALRRRPVRARSGARTDTAARLAHPPRRPQRRGASGPRLGRLPVRTADQSARPRARGDRFPPAGL
ncbi:MAG: hypothetical protein AVDCRST_MAG69-2029, partial [uncultured Solirubrobacteraceae bacterium]